MKEEYDELVASGRENIVFTDRGNVPDMKVITRTQKIYQATGICVGEKTRTTTELNVHAAHAEIIQKTRKPACTKTKEEK